MWGRGWVVQMFTLIDISYFVKLSMWGEREVKITSNFEHFHLQGIRTQIVKSNLSLRERRRKISDFSNTFSYTPDMYFLWYIIIFWLKLGVFSQISIFQNNFFISKIFFEIFWKKFFRFKFLFGLIYGEKKFFEKISKKILTQKN